MRSAASCCQPRQLSSRPRGARTVRGPVSEALVTVSFYVFDSLASEQVVEVSIDLFGQEPVGGIEVGGHRVVLAPRFDPFAQGFV